MIASFHGPPEYVNYFGSIRIDVSQDWRCYGNRRTTDVQGFGTEKSWEPDPQEYELRLHDEGNKKPGYVMTTEYGTESEVRARLKDGGMAAPSIDMLIARG